MPSPFLDITDKGTIKVTVGQVKRFQGRATKETNRSMRKYANELRDEVRKRAQGRPGPRRITGVYWHSIKVTKASSGILNRSSTTSVVSEHPAALRLEKGYVGVDALGRHYNQPPFVHWEPAIQIVRSRWVKHLGQRVRRWWKLK